MVSALLNLSSEGVWSWPPPIPVLKGRRGGSHGLCSSDIEEVEEFSHVYPHPSSGRRGEHDWESGHGLCPSDIEEVEECGHGHPHLPFQTEGWEFAFIFLGSGGVPVEWGQCSLAH